MKNTNKLLTAIIISAFVTGSSNLTSRADSLSFDDFSTDVQIALKDKQTSFGTGDTHQFFEFQYDENGNIILINVNSPTSGAYTITYSYQNASNQRVISRNQTLSPIQGNFINKSINNDFGGAINLQSSTITSITGNFIDNSSFKNSSGQGGAVNIMGSSNITSITGDFIGNYTKADSDAAGGAIYINSTDGGVTKVGTIEGNFINNYSESSGGAARGGAVINYGADTSECYIESLIGDFIGNHSISTEVSAKARGGAISNTAYYGVAQINNIYGDFINNYVKTGGLASGGAIYNDSFATATNEINYIEGDFIGNYAISGADIARGGALLNTTTVAVAMFNDIKGDFIGNYVQSGKIAEGGAVSNIASAKQGIAQIGKINGNFIDNYAKSDNNARGGAVYNEASSGSAEISYIEGNFTGNYALATSNATSGAIYNYMSGSGTAKIDTIIGNFTNNYAKSPAGSVNGGTILNQGTASAMAKINYIEGDFTGNYADGKTIAGGGFIYNSQGYIGTVKGNFTDNYSFSSSGVSRGGAIVNYASGGSALIDNIEGNFIGNYVASVTNIARGGAISNTLHNKSDVRINNISGNFINNYAQAGTQAYGGAIYNYNNTGEGSILEINNIDGNFTGNYAAGSSIAQGGAIYNNDKIVKLNSTLINENYTKAKSGIAQGGAIYNSGIIGEFTNVAFKDNYAESVSGTAQGGAIYTTTNMNFSADNGETLFSGNYTESAGVKEQNAIFVDNDSVTLSLSAINNGQITFDDTINGASGYKLVMTGDETGIVVLNNRVDNAEASFDTAILKLGVTDKSNNVSDVFETSTLNVNSGFVDTTDGSYTNYNIKELTSSSNAKYSIDLTLTPDEQLADTFTIGSGSSGTIYLNSVNVTNTANDNERYILQIIKAQNDSIQLDYDDSKVLQWAEAKMTSDIILAKDFGLYTKDTKNDSLVIRGLLDSIAEWAELDTTEDKIFTFVDGSEKTLTRDITKINGSNITIEGNNNTINIGNHNFLDLISKGQNLSISDVTLENSNNILNNGVLTLNSVILNDADIENNYEFTISGNSIITGDITNNAVLNINDMPKIEGVLTNNSDINISDSEITFDNEINGKGSILISNSKADLNNTVKNQSITINGSDINLVNADTFINNSLYMNTGNLSINDLGMSNLVFDNLSLSGGNININSVDVDLANNKMGRVIANNCQNISGTVNVENLNLISSTNKMSTDILFVDKELASAVSYNGSEQIAYSPIYKYDVAYSIKDNGGYFNFSRSGLVKDAAGYNPAVMVSPVAAQVGGFLTQAETLQQGFYHMNRYTKYTSTQRLAAERSNHYASSKNIAYYRNPLSETSKGLWYNPYTSFEKVNLKGGIGVSNVSYGTLVGGDTDLFDLGRGYKGIISAFVGYNGSHQSYNGNSIYQNGGTLGATGTLYKNNFFTGITASTGAGTGSANTMYGTDNFTMLSAGIASKSGYNWEIQEGKFILQPTLYLGYTFVNTFDYTNAAGVKINSDPLHALQIIPGITGIGNLKNGWQPYVSVNMVFNAMDKTHFKANDISLPQLSVKPYIQYGAGVQKTWGERYTAFAQSMIRNGGRNGIALSFGFRWSLGRNNTRHEKVKTTQRTIIKQLKSSDYKV